MLEFPPFGDDEKGATPAASGIEKLQRCFLMKHYPGLYGGDSSIPAKNRVFQNARSFVKSGRDQGWFDDSLARMGRLAQTTDKRIVNANVVNCLWAVNHHLSNPTKVLTDKEIPQAILNEWMPFIQESCYPTAAGGYNRQKQKDAENVKSFLRPIARDKQYLFSLGSDILSQSEAEEFIKDHGGEDAEEKKKRSRAKAAAKTNPAEGIDQTALATLHDFHLGLAHCKSLVRVCKLDESVVIKARQMSELSSFNHLLKWSQNV